MSKRIASTLFLSLFTAILVSAETGSADRPNFTGSWQLNPSKCEPQFTRLAGLTWVIDQKDTTIHVSEIARHADGKEIKTDFSCTTDGKECQLSPKDHSGTVSFWYNGPVLVQMDFKGRNRETVIKKRMTLSGEGKLMRVDYTPIVGGEVAGKLLFEKQ